MTDQQDLQTRAFLARNRIAELQAQLASAEAQIRDLQQRLALSEQEREVLRGQPDGCIRIGELRPILRRVFGAEGLRRAG